MKKENYSKVTLIFTSLFFVILSAGCNSEEKKQALITEEKNKALEKYISNFSKEQLLSQLFLINIEGNRKFIPVEKTGEIYGQKNEGNWLLSGGCLLFKYNLGNTAEDVRSFTDSIRQFYSDAGDIPPFVAVDQEGGYVSRLRGLTENLPSQKKVAETFSLEEAEALYERQARQIKNLGINVNLAPVVEVETSGNASFLDTRSFGSLNKVIDYGKAEILAFENNGIGTVLKHFPGNSNTDPHTGLPEIRVTEEEAENILVAPFRKLLPYSSALLMSHARVEITGGHSKTEPACLSEFWIKHVVRGDLGFEGVVFSDDIFMAALEKNGYPPQTACIKAFESGIDVLMISEKRYADILKVLIFQSEKSPEFNDILNESVRRVIKFKEKLGLLEYVQVDEENSSGKSKIPSFILTAKKQESVTK